MSLEAHELEFLGDGSKVRRNGVVMEKPASMSWSDWAVEAQRCGKHYGFKDGEGGHFLYGEHFGAQPIWDENEVQEDGCAGGACTL